MDVQGQDEKKIPVTRIKKTCVKKKKGVARKSELGRYGFVTGDGNPTVETHEPVTLCATGLARVKKIAPHYNRRKNRGT